MIGLCAYADLSTSVGVEKPAVLLLALDCCTDIFVILNFHAFIFFQLNITSVEPSNRQAYNSLYAKRRNWKEGINHE